MARFDTETKAAIFAAHYEKNGYKMSIKPIQFEQSTEYIVAEVRVCKVCNGEYTTIAIGEIDCQLCGACKESRDAKRDIENTIMRAEAARITERDDNYSRLWA